MSSVRNKKTIALLEELKSQYTEANDKEKAACMEDALWALEVMIRNSSSGAEKESTAEKPHTFLIIFGDGTRKKFKSKNFAVALGEAAKWCGFYTETLHKVLCSGDEDLELLKIWHILSNRQAIIEAAFEIDAILYDEQAGYVDE